MKIDYNYLLDFEKIESVYNTIKTNSRHKEKIISFHIFKNVNFQDIYDSLKNKNYTHKKYNLFLIKEPKYRLIMSECMPDKIVNHLVSKYVLFPLIEPKLIDMNVATRPNKGTKMALFYVKKYINKLKENNDKIYILKCDIRKFFYSIDHNILLDKLSNIIEDKDIYNLIKTIVESTDSDYLDELTERKINREKKHINTLKISEAEKNRRYQELSKIPRHQKGKGLPIGNMTSQIMAIFYLNNIDHYIKEQLRIKYYVRYMDDLILIHTDKEYLKYCLSKIELEIKKLNLLLNKKTQIYEIHDGLPFLGYKFKLKNKKLYILLNSNTKKRIKRKVKRVKGDKEKIEQIKINYNGYLKHADSGSFLYNLK